ncbi:hypothetical protein [Endozoicomonas sp. SESOKO1]|uniref:hypothetical protein n=1 Tax=Endozoicomonas sp. SESOKO1 TaxID=2828742 RepID=UPI002147B330|nr:hypothetical protein [Endozoicomonas sp. SESOKO1]
MISGNHSIHTKNSLGAAQGDPAYSDSGSGYGRTIKVLQDGSDGKKTVHPTGQSELFNNTFTHYASSAVSAPVTKMSSGTVNVSPDNGLRLASHDLVACHISLERGHSAVFGVLNGMLMHSSVTPGLSYCRKQLDILKTKEPFDEQSFLELAELLSKPA